MAAAASSLSEQLKSLDLETPLPKYPNCYPEVNPVDIYRAHLTSILTGVTGVDAAIIYPALQWTQTLEKGDLVLPVPALRVKGKKPQELAEEWVAKVIPVRQSADPDSNSALDQFPESPLVQKPKSSGTFVQFFFKVDKLAQILIPSILKNRKGFGLNPYNGLKDPEDPPKGKKRVIVEFSSPNIAKPFHAGHLRSTIIGGFLSNLYQGAGWDVIRVNYLGDWGKQYGLLAVAYQKYGDEKALETDPINHLFNIYVKINQDKADEATKIREAEEAGQDVTELKANTIDEQARRYFKAMTENDEKAIALWKHFRELSIERYMQTYARLNIHFDDYSGESQVSQERMDAAAKTMQEKGVSEESEGAVVVDFSKHVAGKPGKSLERPIIKKKDGTALYLTRDISEMMQREDKYHFDHMIYVVASQQDLHLKQLFKIIELMGYKELAAKVQHVNFGMVLGMSTRKGTVKFLDDILRDVGEKMHEVMQKNQSKYEQVEKPLETADILGISAVMVQDLKGKRINNYTFDINVMTSFEGDTGPYLQYAHARLCSITRKVALSESEIASADLSLLTEPHALDLIRVISQYPDVVQNTLKTLEPTTILVYLFKLAHSLSSSYDHLRIMGSEKELMKARMALYDSARTVLNNGMRLLGLTPVERM
ncbi:hypothetical protein B2J93_6610 [Marssonina coronariae]|uniref:arginine--tRNA ligase n=1 Tax=Diplocarpon coronariae TaxID=2795749 RepID=A0A218YUQ4_9HELO|nr:hypothetical protein B2J93_6610 [Marssonina coronariae]